jgi:hypothetical protein
VCIKQVPDTTQVKTDPKTGTLIREGVPFIVNPFDTHALEEGLKLKDKYGLRVVAISMGPPNTEVTLKKALSLGVDDAVLLSDRVFGGADTLATSKVLAEAISKLSKEEEVGVVLCGKQSIDGDTAQVDAGRSDPGFRSEGKKGQGQAQAGGQARDCGGPAAGGYRCCSRDQSAQISHGADEAHVAGRAGQAVEQRRYAAADGAYRTERLSNPGQEDFLSGEDQGGDTW